MSGAVEKWIIVKEKFRGQGVERDKVEELKVVF